jgi:hypothetical protein
MDICREILEVLGKLSPRRKNQIITGDEYRTYSDNYHRGQWIADRVAVSPRIRTTISSKKTMISVYFTRHGFVSIEALPETERFNSVFFPKIILPSFVQFVSLFCPKMQAQDYWLHIDNATRHNSALSLYEIEEL